MPDLSTLRMDIRPVSAFQTWMHADYTFNTYRAYHAVGIYEAIFAPDGVDVAYDGLVIRFS